MLNRCLIGYRRSIDLPNAGAGAASLRSAAHPPRGHRLVRPSPTARCCVGDLAASGLPPQGGRAGRDSRPQLASCGTDALLRWSKQARRAWESGGCPTSQSHEGKHQQGRHPSAPGTQLDGHGQESAARLQPSRGVIASEWNAVGSPLRNELCVLRESIPKFLRTRQQPSQVFQWAGFYRPSDHGTVGEPWAWKKL
jgi:hypothetical protein